MSFADLVVVSIVRGSNFNQACTKLHIDMFVGDDLYLATDYRQDDFFADQIFIAFVVWICHDGSVAEVGLRSGGCYNDKFAWLIRKIVSQMIKLAFVFLMLDLYVAERAVVRTPVYHVVFAYDEPFFVEIYEGFFDRFS